MAPSIRYRNHHQHHHHHHQNILQILQHCAQSFAGRQVRDAATEVPADYEPPATFNISLQHTDPKLSWDAEDPERKRKLQVRRRCGLRLGVGG